MSPVTDDQTYTRQNVPWDFLVFTRKPLRFALFMFESISHFDSSDYFCFVKQDYIVTSHTNQDPFCEKKVHTKINQLVYFVKSSTKIGIL